MSMTYKEMQKQIGGVRSHNIGASNYATKNIQPWDIYGLNII